MANRRFSEYVLAHREGAEGYFQLNALGLPMPGFDSKGIGKEDMAAAKGKTDLAVEIYAKRLERKGEEAHQNGDFEIAERFAAQAALERASKARANYERFESRAAAQKSDVYQDLLGQSQHAVNRCVKIEADNLESLQIKREGTLAAAPYEQSDVLTLGRILKDPIIQEDDKLKRKVLLDFSEKVRQHQHTIIERALASAKDDHTRRYLARMQDSTRSQWEAHDQDHGITRAALGEARAPKQKGPDLAYFGGFTRTEERGNPRAHYNDTAGRTGFIDHGNRVEVVLDNEQDALDASIKLCAAKFKEGFLVRGTEENRRRLCDRAVALGLEGQIRNKDLQGYIQEQVQEKALLDAHAEIQAIGVAAQAEAKQQDIAQQKLVEARAAAALERDAATVSAPKTGEAMEGTEAKATKPGTVAKVADPVEKQRARDDWRDQSGGLEALTTKQRERCDTAYAKWKTEGRGKETARGQGEYVAYVQEKHRDEAQVEALQDDAERSAKLGLTDKSIERVAEEQLAEEIMLDFQADRDAADEAFDRAVEAQEDAAIQYAEDTGIAAAEASLEREAAQSRAQPIDDAHLEALWDDGTYDYEHSVVSEARSARDVDEEMLDRAAERDEDNAIQFAEDTGIAAAEASLEREAAQSRAQPIEAAHADALELNDIYDYEHGLGLHAPYVVDADEVALQEAIAEAEDRADRAAEDSAIQYAEDTGIAAVEASLEREAAQSQAREIETPNAAPKAATQEANRPLELDDMDEAISRVNEPKQAATELPGKSVQAPSVEGPAVSEDLAVTSESTEKGAVLAPVSTKTRSMRDYLPVPGESRGGYMNSNGSTTYPDQERSLDTLHQQRALDQSSEGRSLQR